MAFVDRNRGSRRTIAISAAAVVHVAIGYAFVTGLAFQVLPKIDHVFEVKFIKEPEARPPPPVPIKKPKADTQLTVTKHPLVEAPTGQKIWIPDSPPVFRDPPVSEPPIQPRQLSRGAQPARDRASWITTDDYPASSIRDGEEGAVGISVRIGSDGRVTGCTVIAPSGYAALDALTCRLYAKRARFAPALGADGNAIETSYTDRVRWQLPEQ
jgi:protein TonB